MVVADVEDARDGHQLVALADLAVVLRALTALLVLASLTTLLAAAATALAIARATAAARAAAAVLVVAVAALAVLCSPDRSGSSMSSRRRRGEPPCSFCRPRFC
ncbi:hypothetical protein [Brachybacterium sp. GPGPB12]|uniref:hypothetical protein n=1 Tax=Brachybacterium sp. GPGPB12 TaxID=3023517 RepID=UPI003134525F